MASKSSLSKLEIKLLNAGKMLLHLPSANDEIVSVLQRTEQILFEVQQMPPISINKAMQLIIEVLIDKELLKHPDMNVNISVASCICEIMRIMAPDIPYKKQEMTDFFELVVITFEKLSSANGGCYTKMTRVLKVFSHNRLSVLMLDFKLDGPGLILRLFKQFLTVADFNSSAIVHKMEKIMTMIIEESEEIAPQLIGFLDTSVKNDNRIASAVRLQLVEKVLMNYAARLKPHLPVMRRDMSIALYDYAKMVGRICETSLENNIKEVKKTIPYATEISKSREDSTHKIKRKCFETVRRCQQGFHSEDRNKHVKTFDDSPMTSKSVTDLNGKRKRNDTPLKKKALEHGENLVGKRIKVWWPLDKMYYDGVVESFDLKKFKISYDDGDEELTSLTGRRWELIDNVSTMSNSPLEHGENLVGKRIKVWWPLDKMYYDGVVESFDFMENKHKVSYDDGDEELTCLKGRRWELIENPRQLVLALPRKDSSQCAINFRQRNIAAECVFETFSPIKCVLALPRKVSSSQSGITCVQGYNVKKSTKPILRYIFKKHGDIAAECVLKTSSATSSFLEIICEIVRRIQANDVNDGMEEIERQVSDAEAANINVSWLKAHLEVINKRKEAMKKIPSFPAETKTTGNKTADINGGNVVKST